MARWWLDSHPHTDPLFLQIGFPGPHPPYDPIPRYAEMYRDRDIPIREVSEGDIAGQPAAFQQRDDGKHACACPQLENREEVCQVISQHIARG